MYSQSIQEVNVLKTVIITIYYVTHTLKCLCHFCTIRVLAIMQGFCQNPCTIGVCLCYNGMIETHFCTALSNIVTNAVQLVKQNFTYNLTSCRCLRTLCLIITLSCRTTSYIWHNIVQPFYDHQIVQESTIYT